MINMSKFIYFNDTKQEVRIHPATETHGVSCDMSPIKPLSTREFELPEGTYALLKQWDNGTILVSPTKDDKSDNNEPKHIGKYPIEFSYSYEETGEKIIEFCEDTINTPNIDSWIYIMMNIIKAQAENYLKNND